MVSISDAMEPAAAASRICAHAGATSIIALPIELMLVVRRLPQRRQQLRRIVGAGEERIFDPLDTLLGCLAGSREHAAALGLRHHVLDEAAHEVAVGGQVDVATPIGGHDARRDLLRVRLRLLGRPALCGRALVGFPSECSAVGRSHVARAALHQHRRFHVGNVEALRLQVALVPLRTFRMALVGLPKCDRARVPALDHVVRPDHGRTLGRLGGRHQKIRLKARGHVLNLRLAGGA